MNSSRGATGESTASHDSEQRFRALVEGVAIAVWESAPDGTIQTDSPSWRAFTGQSLEDFLQSHWESSVHPDDLESARSHWRHCVRAGCVYQAEMRLLRANGQWCWTEAHAVPLRHPDGTIRKWVGMHTDISERKRSEEQRAQHERQLQLALDISGTSFWNYDIERGQVWMDHRMQLMWGERTEAGSMPIDYVMQRIHPEDRQAVWDSVSQALNPSGSGVYNPHDYRIVLDDGTVRWLAANGLARFRGQGSTRQPVELFGTVLNITHRKQAEAALRDSEERLQQLNAQLEDRVRERTQELVKSEQELRSIARVAEQRSHELKLMALELSQTEERERRRLAAILHDHLQQLLVAAKMRVETLAKEEMAADQQERLIGIATVVDVAINTTRSMAVDLVPPILHTQGLPAALPWLVQRMYDQHGLTVEMQIDGAANPVNEEVRDLLFQAARELMLNVIKHAGVTHASLSLYAEPDQWLLEVSDDGEGIAADFVPEASISFGLFYVRERLSALGGSLDISSQPSRGTQVCIRVPR